MADNPFDQKTIEKYAPFFKTRKAPSFPTEKDLATEYGGLQSFLGVSDYSKQLQQAQDAAKLQAALSLAARGFASMGATPKRGESPFATVGRELLAPVGADMIPVATELMKQKAALTAAERAEDRQIKLAALKSARDRQTKDYQADLAAESQARQFILMSQKTDATPSADYTVDGKPTPIMIEKSWNGKFRYLDTAGNVIPKDKLGVYKKGVRPFKSTVTKATDIEILVKDADGKESWRPVEATITTHFDASGRPESTVMTEASTEQVLRLSGKKKNARKAPKPGSKTSAYFPPKSQEVYLTQDAVDAFEMNKNHVGKQATATTYLPKPDPDIGADLPSFSTVTVGGKTYDMRDHTGWDSKSGTIKRELPSGKVSFAAEDLWQVSKPGEGVERKEVRGQFFVPGSDQLSGIVPMTELTSYNMDGDLEKTYYARINGKTTRIPENQFFRYDERNEPFKKQDTVLRVSGNKLEDLQKVKGFENATANDIVELWTSKPVAGKGGSEQKQYRFAGNVVNIPDDVFSASLQASNLSDVQKAQEGLTFRTNEAVTNIGRTDLKVAGVILKPGETGTFTNVDLNNLTSEVRASLRPYREGADTSTTEFMFTQDETYNGVNYAPGDRISLTPTKYNLATKDAPTLIRNLTKDSNIKSNTLKRNNFKEVWKTVQKLQESVIPVQNRNRTPTESELKSLLGQFPTGRRGKDALSTAILNMLQDPGTVTPASTNAATVVEENQSFADQVKAQLDSAAARYAPLKARGTLETRPWDQLSYIEKKAFASLPKKGMSEATVNANWQAAQKKLRDQKATFNIPKQSESEEVAATAGLKILTDYLLDSADMDNTGKLVGPFAELGATVLADYGIFTSSKSQRVNQIITLMRAHLRTLSSSEGTDARPSNYRLALQESLLPIFNNPMELNRRNLETISRKLESSLRSLFTPESTRDNVIPQSWVKAAIEAGVKNPKVNPKLYASFMDPNDSINTDFELVTRAQIMEDLGKFKFQLPDFQSLRVGRPLPPDADGRVFIKISPTEVQLAKQGTYVPDTRATKHVFK
tara:strand:- start:3918 stop:7058 length:3141 start_codon:yes stop_codon:yes gene_type:complete